MAEVVLKNVGKRFGENQAVDAMDLTIHDGEFVVLLGPTGAGKTTTLRLIGGLERADSGSISIASNTRSIRISAFTRTWRSRCVRRHGA